MAVRSISPTYYHLPAGFGLSWQALARFFAYSASDRRDLRLDWLRGFCVFAMIVDHVGGSSWLYALTGGNRWLVSAAEGFVFLSGLTMGLVYREKLRRLGLREAARSALRRAGTLYLLTVALTLIFTALARLTTMAIWTDRAMASGEPVELLVSTLTLHYTFHGTDVLALYTILVAAAPLLFWLLHGGKTVHLVAGSWLLWVGYQVFPAEFTIPWAIRNANYFPLAAWQVLFVGGLALGWHRQYLAEALRDRLTVLRSAPIMLSLASPALALGSVGWIDRGPLSQVELDPMVGFFAKPNLGPGRLMLFLALFVAAYVVLSVAWQPINRLFGWLLLPLGQTALYGYTMQLFILLPLYNLFGIGSDAPELILINTLGQTAGVLAIWAMVRKRFLFRVVPK